MADSLEDGGQKPIILKKVKVIPAGAHGGAWKVAYADFVTAMMAFFLLLWLLGATTEDQRKGLADYFTPTLVKIKDSGAGAHGLLAGDSLTSVDDYPNRQGQTGNKEITVPKDAIGAPKEAERMIQRFYRSPFLPAPLADRVALMDVESIIQVSRSM